MNPTILLAPGAWHSSTCFRQLQLHLDALNYPNETVDHPSIGAEPPTKSLDDDVHNLRRALSRLIDEEEKSVVLLGHSYGGVVISNASEGFGLAQRQQQGKQGGIEVVVYLAAFVLGKGTSLFDGLGRKWAWWMSFEGEYCYSSNERQIFYHDVPSDQQDEALAQLKHTSAAVFHGKVVHEPWRYMPVAYLYCDGDQALPFAVQEKLVESMVGSSVEHAPAPLVLTDHLSASHSPFLSMPDQTAESIRRVVGEVQGRKLN
ncbi:hypothetical protein FE257_011154 [Aspergillus nanangensis]|uniref:AB hydrolase-1 domain-containing protein n=1 Tax=Aspergillus nanangensis TaxID=2582783 RepID=A0AAD4CI90_ASPNN|nr:hypothetical protein FE257_011154 [Aspergillus nanangensis]